MHATRELTDRQLGLMKEQLDRGVAQVGTLLGCLGTIVSEVESDINFERLRSVLGYFAARAAVAPEATIAALQGHVPSINRHAVKALVERAIQEIAAGK